MSWVLLGTGLVLFAAAWLALYAELFVPSHGILAGICVALVIAGVVVFYLANPWLGILAGVGVGIAAPFAFYFVVKFYPKSPVGRRIMLQRPSAAPASDNQVRLQQLSGKHGKALSTLRPSGICDIDGQRINCVTEGNVIDAETPIEVVRVVDMRVIVRALAAATADTAPPPRE